MLELKVSGARRLGVAAATLVLAMGAWILLVATGPTGDVCVSDTPLFAFTSAASQLRQTDVAVFHEGEVVRVTTDHLSQDPSFSPDGGRVVFSSGRDGEFDPEVGYRRLALFTANLTGGDEERLTSGIYDYQPDWSPDGTRVVFVRRRYSDGQNPQLNLPEREELWTVDIETGEERLLLRAPAKRGDPYSFHSPVWSPDGTRIAFSRAGGGEHGLWVMDADGSNPQRLLADSGVGYFDSPALAWAPSGEHLAFNGGTEHGAGIVVMDLDDRKGRLLTSGSGPAWSPDGTRVAYFEFQPPDNGYRIAFRDADGTNKEYPEGARAVSPYGEDLDWACTGGGGEPTALPTPAEPRNRCDGTFRVVHRSVDPGNLVRPDFTPAGDGWAVGEGRARVVRFDSNSFAVVGNVPPATGTVFLNDVSALASDDVFVAGGHKTRRWSALMLRWNGDEWARMDTPSVPGAILQGVAAIAPDDVWAVGFFYQNARSHGLVLHFDGTRWSRADIPRSGRNEGLMAVGASSPTNVWAIGNRGEDRAMVLRYDGTRWADVELPPAIATSPARLNAIEVVSARDVWIVGNLHRPGHSYLSSGALHFDGRRWRRDYVGDTGSLTDVQAVGRREVWAVGYENSRGLEGTARPLAVRHRNSWQRVGIEDPGVGGEFTGLAVDHRGDLWAVGEKAGSQWVIQRACPRRDRQ